MAEASLRANLATYQRRASSLVVAMAVVLAVATTIGCGGDGLAEVSGTIVVDGEPAKMGAIAFFPVDGDSRAESANIVDGAYSARVPPGMCKVEIRVSKVIGQRNMYGGDAPARDILGEALPDKYNNMSELSLDVQPGVNEQNYELESK